LHIVDRSYRHGRAISRRYGIVDPDEQLVFLESEYVLHLDQMVKRVKDADGNAVQDIDWLNLKLYTKIPGDVRVETATDVRISMRKIIRDSYAAVYGRREELTQIPKMSAAHHGGGKQSTRVYAYIPPNMCNTVPTVYGSEFIWGHAADSVLEFTI
ncbi:hypothetical protein AaE_006235, partial [Aphanomyces astaci]